MGHLSEPYLRYRAKWILLRIGFGFLRPSRVRILRGMKINVDKMWTQGARDPNSPLTKVAKIGQTVFFLLFGLAGTGFMVFFGIEAGDRIAVRFWDETPCTMVRCAPGDGKSKPATELDVEYLYKVDGKEYRGTRVRIDSEDMSVSKVQRLAADHPAGSEGLCFVDGDDPAQAVLEQSDLWLLLFMLLPLVFMLVGYGGIYLIWKRRADAPKKAGQGKGQFVAAPISSSAKNNKGKKAGVAFGGLFLSAGLVMCWFMTVSPLLKLHDAKDWPAVPCEIVSSEVESHSDDDGTTYSVDILFSYTVEGKTYQSNTYDVSMGNSSGREGKQAIVDAHPVGMKTTCFADPDDPGDAIISREVPTMVWFGLLSLVFALAGGLILWGCLRKKRSKKELEEESDFAHGEDREVVLTSSGRWKKVVGTLVFTLLWNGIVSVFVVMAVAGWQEGNVDWFLTLFMIPFVLVGLAGVVAIIHTMLACGNPRLTLTLSRSGIHPGEPFDISWTATGRTDRLQSLRIVLELHEEATYRRGTDTHTSKETVFEMEILRVDDSMELLHRPSGQASVTIPAGAMHSFAANNNRLIWRLCVYGDIPRWPDVKDQHELTVRPADLKGGL